MIRKRCLTLGNKGFIYTNCYTANHNENDDSAVSVPSVAV